MDGHPLTRKAKCKRDGVYYTPEWVVVERIVKEKMLRPRLEEIKRECGWPDNGLPNKKAIDTSLSD